MSKDFIKVSEKHGLNPSMQTCFYCGEVTGIALMGKLKNDEEAPKYFCNSVEPCDACKEKYKDYVLVVEKPNNEEAPTGRWFAIKKEAVDENFRKYPIVFMNVEDFSSIVEQNEETFNK